MKVFAANAALGTKVDIKRARFSVPCHIGVRSYSESPTLFRAENCFCTPFLLVRFQLAEDWDELLYFVLPRSFCYVDTQNLVGNGLLMASLSIPYNLVPFPNEPKVVHKLCTSSYNFS